MAAGDEKEKGEAKRGPEDWDHPDETSPGPLSPADYNMGDERRGERAGTKEEKNYLRTTMEL